jgi:hypothetical protein
MTRGISFQDEVPGSSPGRPTSHSRRSQRCRQRTGSARRQPGPRWGRTLDPRRHAHRPFRARPPGRQAHDHHPPWSPPAQDGSHAAAAATSRWRLLPCPPRSHKRRRSARRPGLPSRAAGQARPPAVTPPGPGPPPTPTDHRDSAAPPPSGPARPSIQPLQHAAAHPDSTVPVVPVARRLDLVPTAAGGGMRWTRPDERGGQPPAGHRTAGHRTAGHQTAGHPTGWTPDGLDTQRAGHRTHWTPSRPDTGRLDRWSRTTQPLRGHHLVDADRRPTPWQASWPCRPRRPRSTAGCRLDAPPGSRFLGDQPTRTAQQQDYRDGPGHRRDRQLQVLRRPAGASAHCCPRTISGRE